MARRKFRLITAANENPESGELLYPGSVFEADESLIPVDWLAPRPGETAVLEPMPDSAPEVRIK